MKSPHSAHSNAASQTPIPPPVSGVRRDGKAPRPAALALASLADQVLSSVTNFILLLLVARTFDIRQVGAFSIAYTVYFLAIVISRGLAIEPLLVRCSPNNAAVWRQSSASAVGLACTLGFIVGTVLVVAGILIGGPLSYALVPLGLTLPGLLTQDAWRYIFFAERRPLSACINDSAWLIVQTVGYAAIFSFFSPSLTAMILIWGSSATASAIAGSFQARVLPRLDLAAVWFGKHRDISLGFAGDYIAQRGSQQIALAVVGAVSGLAAVGAIGAARSLFAALTTVQTGFNVIAIPEGARLRRESPSSLRRYAAFFSGAMCLMMILAGLGMLLLPDHVGHFLLKSNWDTARALIIPMAFFSAAVASSGGYWILLRILEAAREMFYLRSAFGIITVIGALLGTLAGGPEGAVWAMSIASAGLAGVTAHVALRTLGAKDIQLNADGDAMAGRPDLVTP